MSVKQNFRKVKLWLENYFTNPYVANFYETSQKIKLQNQSMLKELEREERLGIGVYFIEVGDILRESIVKFGEENSTKLDRQLNEK